MSPYAFVATWLVQSTGLGLCVLLLPRLFRVTSPHQLTWWWGSNVGAVLLAPLMPLMLPARGGAAVPMATFVESATIAVAPGLQAASAPSAFAVLVLVWTLGAAIRLAWLAAGHRRLLRRVSGATRVDDDPALVRARSLVPPRGRGFPLASVPVDVLATASASPCAFGWRRVRILVPHALRAQPEPQRVAVYLHELLHVARGDVHHAWADEVVRLVCWWQPAAWWLLARLKLAREHEVDREVVTRTGRARAYVEALVWCSTLRPVLSFGPHAGGPRHALVRRVAVICKGGEEMSRTRRWTTNAAMIAIGGAVAGTLGLVAPLRATVGQDGSRIVSDQGPLERIAVLPTLDAPAPRRVVNVEPVVHGDSTFVFRFRVHVVVDESGRVAEARIPAAVPPDVPTHGDAARVGLALDLRNAWTSSRAAVLDAVRQWQFEAPAAAPMLLLTDVVVGPAGAGGALGGPESSATGQAGAVREPLRIGGTIGPPKKIVDVPPAYPQVAKDAGVSGVVIVEATIDTEGRVQDVRLLRSIPLLDQAAIDAVKQWRYTPTWLNGEPVPVTMTMTINFTLQ